MQTMLTPGRIHEKVAAFIRGAVTEGRLRPGDKLPSLPQLSQQFNCSYAPVRQALTTLANEGVVQPRQGAGVFVRARRREKLIGLCVHNVRNADHARLASNVSAAAEREGYSVMLCAPYAESGVPHDRGARIEIEFVDRIASLNGSGIIKSPTTIEMEDAIRARMRERRLPFVIVNDFWSERHDFHHAVCDRRASMDVALDHLVRLGHSQIAFFNAMSNLEPGAPLAFAAAASSIGAAGHLLPSQAEEALRAMTAPDGPGQVTAVVVLHYSDACDLLGGLRARGLRVPDDVSVLVLSGLPDAQFRPVKFTTVEPPMEKLAASALRLLLEDSGAPLTHQHFQPTLREGHTSGPCVARDTTSGARSPHFVRG